MSLEFGQPFADLVDGRGLAGKENPGDGFRIELDAARVVANERRMRGKVLAVRREVLHAFEHFEADTANTCHLRLQG